MNLQALLPRTGKALKSQLARCSFRTGVTVLALCVPLYVLSFAQMALPIAPSLKGTLWVVLFGLAKTAQYAGLTILGAKGIKRVKDHWKKNNHINTKTTER